MKWDQIERKWDEMTRRIQPPSPQLSEIQLRPFRDKATSLSAVDPVVSPGMTPIPNAAKPAE